MAAAKAPPWPSELRFQKDRAELLIRFDDGLEVSIPYELLRVESPSAETKGHGSETPPPPTKKRKVKVTGAEPVGRYALRIRFDDGHNAGLYTWAYLRELGEQKSSRMAAYLGRLKELGLSRD
ncbi:MAG: gamma-butyrobetaine hydroxylase-like domain-containing protein [Hyphomonadaceae bacterium]